MANHAPSSLSSSFRLSLLFGLVMLSLWGLAVYSRLETPPIFFTTTLFFALSALIWFDFDHYRIPNWVTYPLILIGGGLVLVQPSPLFVSRLVGAIVGFGVIWALNAYWLRTRGRDGIGMGDAKLLAAAGAWLGVIELPTVTLIASAGALIWIGGMGLLGRQRIEAGNRLPFGPFIAIGFWSIWLFGGLSVLRV